MRPRTSEAQGFLYDESPVTGRPILLESDRDTTSVNDDEAVQQRPSPSINGGYHKQ